MHRTFYFNYYLIIICIFIILNSCSTISQKRDIPEIILHGSQQDINMITYKITSGKIKIHPYWLLDMREFPRDRALLWDHQHFGVDRISDYFICLLEGMHHIGTADILNKEYGYNIQEVERIEHEACTSLVYNLDPKIHKLLIDYWLKHLR